MDTGRIMQQVANFERPRVLKAADAYLKLPPHTIVEFSSKRSAGGRHDYFSEGDYWWPDPAHPGGPYIQRDGMSNPDNFVAHRHALIQLSLQVPALTAAWLLTGKQKYAQHAASHLRAWFVSPETRMKPNLEYAQAISGRFTGRGIGIIDTIHLVEVARSATLLAASGAMTEKDHDGVKQWFADYVTWMTTSQHGLDEKAAKNNHGTCWTMQVAEFATCVGRLDLLDECRTRYKSVLLPNQVATDGSFPLELKRTKPYSYSLFNLDAMGMVCQILSDSPSGSSSNENLWRYNLPDGRGMAAALRFMEPYIADKSKWPYPRDVEYFDNLPVRQPSLLFGGIALDVPTYIHLWKRLDPDPSVEEIIRNFPIRQPLLWLHNIEPPAHVKLSSKSHSL